MAPSRTQSMAAGLGGAIGAVLAIAVAMVALGDRFWARADDMASIKTAVEQIRSDVRDIKNQITPAPIQRTGRRP